MRGREGHVEEERARDRMFLNEPHRLPCSQLGGVALFPHRLVVPMPVQAATRATQGSGLVGPIVDRWPEDSVLVVEATTGWEVFRPSVAEVPLAHDSRAVARLLQSLR